MKYSAVSIIVLLIYLGTSSAAVVLKTGDCPKVSGQASFKREMYLGNWYEYKRFPAVFEQGLECNKAVYRDVGDNKIGVVNIGFLRANLFGRNYVINRFLVDGNATVPDPTKPAELSVSFEPVDFSRASPNYIIFATNYNDWSVVFSCEQFRHFNIQFAWILTREQGVAPQNLDLLESVMEEAGIDVSKFHVVDQEDCPA